MANAVGTKMALLINEPLHTAHTTGSSRLALTPETCCAFSAKSSPKTPDVFLAAAWVKTEISSIAAALFLAATLVSNATSSMIVAISSIKASRLEAIGRSFI